MAIQTELKLSQFKNDDDNYFSKLNSQLNIDISDAPTDFLDKIKELDNALILADKRLKRLDRSVNKYIVYGVNESENLKLHELSYHIYKNSDDINTKLESIDFKDFDIFSDFCEIEYNNFIEWMKDDLKLSQKDYDNHIIDRIGRTSSFNWKAFEWENLSNTFKEYYLNNAVVTDLYTLIGEYDGTSDGVQQSTIQDIVYIMNEVLDAEFDEDYRGDSDAYDTCYNALCDIISDLEELQIIVKKYFDHWYVKDTLQIIRYIKNFKRNQIEYFESFFEDFIDFRKELI